ncbi:MBL fold metallo-hydrolase, partial [Candidatus Saccharibacteria bacterium]|nr:MBL fold metallo-hydrolase [Candidatus Saccharibacteria bacterium]NIW79827.1 MBL fold metallo-hydrolase [Calditrichia bacterium]
RQFNTTLVMYRIGNTIIDAGPPNQWHYVRQFLSEKPCQRVLITHHHEDHSGNGRFIQTTFDAPVMAPASGQKLISDGYPLQFYRRVIWGKPPLFEAEPLPEVVDLDGGLTVHSLAAPGHSEDMTCLWIPERGWMFGGDIFVSGKPRFSRQDEDQNLEIESLRKILNYEFDTLFCGHRGVVKNGYREIKKKLDYLESLKEQVQELYYSGESVEEIRNRILGKEGWMSWVTAFHFSKENIIRAFVKEEKLI